MPTEIAPITETRSGYEPIPQLRDVDSVMRQYAKDTVNAILFDRNNYDIVIPLNGSILPLYYIYENLLQNHPDQIDSFTNRVRFMQDIKAESGMTALLFDRENSPEGAYLIDDIADELHVADAMTDIYPQLSIFAPVQKKHTQFYRSELADEDFVDLQTTTRTDDKWIASSCGMNEGADVEPFEKKALLATLQRFARSGFFKDPSEALTPDQKIHFFQNQLLPQFDECDNLFTLIFELETVKNNGQWENMIHLSRKIIPTILRKIQAQKIPPHNLITSSGI